MDKTATIRDVAARSGFSVPTVSRVLSGSPYPVSREAKEKILQAAEELNYTPNLLARGLKTNGLQELAVVVPSITNPFYTSLISGVEQTANRKGFSLVLYQWRQELQPGEEISKKLMGKQAGGLILASESQETLLRNLQHSGMKVVLADCTPDSAVAGTTWSSVYVDYRKGSEMAVQHLLELGHRQIAYLGRTPDRQSRKDRLEGYHRALAEAGIPSGEHRVLLSGEEPAEPGDTEFETGTILGERLLALQERPTAVVALNDMLAYGLLRCFHKKGIRVPEDISVVGFDDCVFSEVSNPPLTTVRVPVLEMGRTAADLVIGDITGDSGRAAVLLEPELVVRGSTAKLQK